MNLPRNMIFNFLSWLIPIGATFVFTPIILRGLGEENYGLYALVTGFIAYSFYLSISRAIPVYVAEYRVKNQSEKLGEVISATLAINLCVGLLALLFFLSSSNWLVANLLQIEPAYQRSAVVSFYLAGGSLFFMMIGQVFSAIPQALHRFDIYSSIALATTLLLQVGNVLLVITGHSVISLFVWNFILMFINCIAYWLLAKKLLPQARLTFAISPSLVFGIIKYSGGVITYQIIANCLLIFERGWLTRTSGHESLTYYVVPMTVALSLHAFINSLSLVIFPLATEANAEQDKARLKKIYTRSLKFLNVLIVFLVVTLCVCSNALLTVWVSAAFAERTSTVLILLTIAFGMVALGIVTVTLADGLGRPWFNALLLLSWILIAVPVMIWLTPKFNVIGSAYGRFFSIVLTMPIYILFVEYWMFEKCLWGFWRKSILALSLFGAIAGAVQYLLLSFLNPSWFILGFVIILSGVFYTCGLLLFPYFEVEDKKWITTILTNSSKRFVNFNKNIEIDANKM